MPPFWLLCRNEERGVRAKTTIEQATGNKQVHLAVVDISEQDDVRAFCASFPESHVDVLILNAGVLKDQTHTSEGIEKTLATHLVGHFLLTHGLLNRLRKGARSRVILVSSGGMYSQKLNVKELEHPPRLLMALLPMRVPNGVWWSSTDYGKRLYLNMASRPIACILDGPIHPAYKIRFQVFGE